MNKPKILFVFGTRPEAIKLAPLINTLKTDSEKYFDTYCCSSGQHKEMLSQVNNFFKIDIDFNLNIMKKNQTLSNISSEILINLDLVLNDLKPDAIIVHGDTSTTAIASLSAFYNKINVFHVEAGLRTNDKYAPFPEEINRSIVSKIADLNFAPTEKAKNNLLNEGVNLDSILVTGNTVIDSLILAQKKLKNYEDKEIDFLKKIINQDKKIILVTGHRRENFGKKLENICLALLELSTEKDVQVIYPCHLNPNVQSTVRSILKNKKNITLTDPLGYAAFTWLMDKSYIILTDSGGIQEEAPSLNKPVFVLRDKTERPEGIKSGTSILVGTEKNTILENTLRAIRDKNYYKSISSKENPYGDGKASEKILEFLKKYFDELNK